MSRRTDGRCTLLGALGLLLAWIGLVSQLSLGSITLRSDKAAADISMLAMAGIDCQPLPSSPPGNPHRHHGAEPSLCPIRIALELPGYVIAPLVEFANAATVVVVRDGMPPPSCGPPPLTARVGEPRAPPTQA